MTCRPFVAKALEDLSALLATSSSLVWADNTTFCVDRALPLVVAVGHIAAVHLADYHRKFPARNGTGLRSFVGLVGLAQRASCANNGKDALNTPDLHCGYNTRNHFGTLSEPVVSAGVCELWSSCSQQSRQLPQRWVAAPTVIDMS
eukprot:1187545-Prorocentrum_minimum.AAC.7